MNSQTSSTSAIPIFGSTIYELSLPQQFQHLKDQEFCVLLQSPDGWQQTDGVYYMGGDWYNPPPQQQSSSSTKTCGPPIPRDKHVNIKVYGTYDNIKKRNYDQLRHTLHYEYDEKDVHTNPNTRNIAFQSFQQFAQHYNECKTHPITSQLMSLSVVDHDDWGTEKDEVSYYSLNIMLGIVTSIDHTNRKKPITLQQLTIKNNNNDDDDDDSKNNKHNNTIEYDCNAIVLVNSDSELYPTPCIGWLCLIVVDVDDIPNEYYLPYPLLDLGETVKTNDDTVNDITSLISQCSQEQQQALYEIVYHWQNVEDNDKQYTVEPIPEYDDINPYDYINIVKQAPALHAKRIAERYAQSIADAILTQRSLLLQLYPNHIIPRDILISLIEKEYQYNCLLPEEKEAKKRQKQQQVQDNNTTSQSSLVVSSNVTFDLSTVRNAITSVEDFAIVDCLNHLQQHVDYIVQQNLFDIANTNSGNAHALFAKCIADETKRIVKQVKRTAEETKRIAEEKKRIVEETKRIVEEEKRIAEETKRIAEEGKQKMLQLQKQKQHEYANAIRNERLIIKPIILQSFNNIIHDEQILDRFIEDEYQTNCILPSSSSSSPNTEETKKKQQEEDGNDSNNTYNIIKSLFTLSPDRLLNINNIIIHDYILYLEQTLEHMKCSLTNEPSPFTLDDTTDNSIQLQQHSQNDIHNNPNNNHHCDSNNNQSSILNQQDYKYQSYLRREYNIKYRSQCTSISQTTIDCILNNNALHIEPSTNYDDNDNHYTSSNIISTATSQTSSFIRPYTTLLSHQLALSTTYATMRNNQLHFLLAQRDSKQEEEQQQLHQQQEQGIVIYDNIDKDQPPLSQHHNQQQQCQQSEVEFLREQLRTKDQQLLLKDKLYQQQLRTKDQQLRAKDQQLRAKDQLYQQKLQQLHLKEVQLQQSNTKDQQIAILMTLLSEKNNGNNTHNNNNNNNNNKIK